MPLSPVEKVKKAERLIAEARREMRRLRKQEADATLCRCGHRRDEHGPTHSMNFTAGLCLVPRCPCRYHCIPTTNDLRRKEEGLELIWD